MHQKNDGAECQKHGDVLMKKSVVLLACPLLLLSSQTMASFMSKLSTKKQYIEGQVGWVNYNVDTRNSDLNSNSGDFLLAARWGKYFTPSKTPNLRVAGEIGAEYFDQASIGNLSITQTVVEFLGVLNYKFRPKFSIFGKAGVAIVTQNYELLRTTDHEDAKGKFVGSIGGEFMLERNLAATLTATYIDGENLNAYTTRFEGHIASTISYAAGLKYYFS